MATPPTELWIDMGTAAAATGQSVPTAHGQDVCYLFKSPQQRDDWKRINHRHQGRAASIWESSGGERFHEVRVMFTPETDQERTEMNERWRTRLRPGGLWIPYAEQEG